ncbi:hypothetical protein DSO57_1020370 [Entomophthora muscae]|uniref:Uncharacterized protein n=1 Tax=Entomophthora muscae TaxID=34485 RepID=A0ACC2UCK9_9FUNG|nr:hypothetical protein DSO57_1020370 [Entomophthora muscae]
MKLFIVALVSLVAVSAQGNNLEHVKCENIGSLPLTDKGNVQTDDHPTEDVTQYKNIFKLDFDQFFPAEYTPAFEKLTSLLASGGYDKSNNSILYIDAGNHEIQESDDPLISYIKSNTFPDHIGIVLPYTSNLQVLDDLIKAATKNISIVEVSSKDKISPEICKKYPSVDFNHCDDESTEADEPPIIFDEVEETIPTLPSTHFCDTSFMSQIPIQDIVAQEKPILSVIKPEKNDFITVDPFNDIYNNKVKDGFTAIEDCDDGNCLLDRDELKETDVYIGLVFNLDFSMKYPPLPDVFKSFLTSHNENKRPYTGIHIQAEDYPILEHTNPLMAYINDITVGQGNRFPKNSLITLPYIPDSQVFDQLVKQAVEKFKTVFISLQDTQVPLRTLKKFTGAVFISSDSAYAEANSRDGIKMVHASFRTGESGEAFSSTLDVC